VKRPDFSDIFDWFIRLVPTAALFSLFFTMEADLKYLGFLGVITLVFAFRRDCPTCVLRAQAKTGGGDGEGDGWRPFPGH